MIEGKLQDEQNKKRQSVIEREVLIANGERAGEAHLYDTGR